MGSTTGFTTYIVEQLRDVREVSTRRMFRKFTLSMNKKVAIRVDNLVKTFKIPTEASNGIKQKLINVLKGKKGYARDPDQ